jgi:YHS domain-containing protein
MYRLIFIILLLIVLYVLLRQMFHGFKNPKKENLANSTPRDQDQEQDQMIEDPVCHVFVPKRIAVMETIGGREYCFCSKECAVTFRSERPV